MEHNDFGPPIGGEPKNLNLFTLVFFTVSAFALGYYLGNQQNNKVSILPKEELE